MIKSIFSHTTSLLTDVIYNDLPFAIAVKQKFKKGEFSKEEKRLISMFAGCELRHHLIFTELVKESFPDLPQDVELNIYIALANNIFIKHFEYEDVIDNIYNLFLLNALGKTREQLKEFFNTCLNTKELIPSKFDRSSNDFLSLRFNTPLWLVKMWHKNYGRSLAYKILKANAKAPLNTVRVNNYIISTDEVLQKDTLYSKAFVEDVVIYHGNLPFNKQRYIESYKVFPQKMGYKFISDKLDIDSLKGIAIYQGAPSNFYLEVSLKGLFQTPIDLILSNYQDFYQVKSNISNFKINNLKAYHSEPSSIITCVSKKVDMFFVLPKSSNFELLRSAPDYFLRFKPTSLDGLINEQYQALHECSTLVEENGQLIYIIPTISNKEGHGNIFKFLKEHPEFKLLEERQLFPFDPYDSSLYYAILRKVKVEEND